jgi:hypothetical protein
MAGSVYRNHLGRHGSAWQQTEAAMDKKIWSSGLSSADLVIRQGGALVNRSLLAHLWRVSKPASNTKGSREMSGSDAPILLISVRRRHWYSSHYCQANCSISIYAGQHQTATPATMAYVENSLEGLGSREALVHSNKLWLIPTCGLRYDSSKAALRCHNAYVGKDEACFTAGKLARSQALTPNIRLSYSFKRATGHTVDQIKEFGHLDVACLRQLQ